MATTNEQQRQLIERELPGLAGIGVFIQWLEELLALLSGPILTAGLAIALIDLLTDGQLLTTVPVLLWIWACSQALGLDAQFIGAAAKLARAFRLRRAWPAIGYVILCLALGYVGYLASNVFATQEANGITTAQALARLGMDNATWIIQRSLLAVILVFLSGFLRYVAPLKNAATAEDIAAQTEQERLRIEAELKLAPLRERLQAQKIRGASQTAAAARGVASALVTGRTAPKITPSSQPFELSHADRSNSPVTIALDDPDEEENPPDFDPDPAPNPPDGIGPTSPGADWPDADRSNVRAYPANSRRAVSASASVHRSSNPAETPSDEGTEKPAKNEPKRGRKPKPARGDTGMSDEDKETLRKARLAAARKILAEDPDISYGTLARRIALATQRTISESTAHSLAMEITGRRPKSRTGVAAQAAASANE